MEAIFSPLAEELSLSTSENMRSAFRSGFRHPGNLLQPSLNLLQTEDSSSMSLFQGNPFILFYRRSDGGALCVSGPRPMEREPSLSSCCPASSVKAFLSFLIHPFPPFFPLWSPRPSFFTSGWEPDPAFSLHLEMGKAYLHHPYPLVVSQGLVSSAEGIENYIKHFES